MNSIDDSKRLRKNRIQLIAILAIVLIPAIGSTFMYYTGIGMPEGTNNNGLLVDPVIPVNDMELHTLADDLYYSWNNTGNFRLVVLVDGACDKLCSELVHNMRQVHVRLAKRSTSLERWLVQFDDQLQATPVPEGEQSLAAAYPRMAILKGNIGQWRQRLATSDVINTRFNGHQIVLIDRRGNVIMAFNREHAGQPMLDDVLFLIKSTQ